MRLSEKDVRLSPEVERELEALDRALAGEPVEAGLEPLAELARELRAERPEPSAELSAELDRLAAAGFPRTDGIGSLAGRLSERARRLPPPRRLVPAVGAASVFLVVIGVAVSQIGDSPEPGAPSLAPTDRRGEVAEPAKAEPAPTAAERVQESDRITSLSGGAETRDTANRKVTQDVNMTLSTEPGEFREVADEVFQVTAAHQGFVAASNISSGDPGTEGGGRAHASFELKIPAAQLQSALTELSELAHISARSDGTADVTGRFRSAEDRVETLSAERDDLRQRIAATTTLDEEKALHSQLRLVREELRSAREAFDDIRQRVHLVPVSVTINADAESMDDGEWGLDDALDDAGRILKVAAGVALVSAAVLVPFALLIGVCWLAWGAYLRRRRERTLD